MQNEIACMLIVHTVHGTRIRIIRTQNARKFEYIDKFEPKLKIIWVVDQELRYDLLAKPVENKKFHATVPFN
jgi:hypothetical protein